MAKKLLIDITRLGEYDVLIKDYIGVKESGINTKIGTVPSKIGSGENEQSVNDLVDYINKKVALVNADATALAGRVSANEEAIGTANTAAEGEASNASGLYLYIDTAAAAAVTKVVAGADTSYDTLKEIEAWILNNTTGAAKMQSDIKFLQGTDGTTHTKESASIPGVKLYIDDLVSNKNVDAAVAEGELLLTATPSGNKVTIGTTEKLQNAVARAEASVQSVSEGTSVENYVALAVDNTTSAVKVSVDDSALKTKIEGMYTDMQGNTTETVASVEAKVNDLEICTAKDITDLFPSA